jgi:hypothetical protein
MAFTPLKYPTLDPQIWRVASGLDQKYLRLSDEVKEIISEKNTGSFLEFLLRGEKSSERLDSERLDPDSVICGLLSSKPGAEYVQSTLKSLLKLHVDNRDNYTKVELCVAPLSYFHLLNALYAEQPAIGEIASRFKNSGFVDKLFEYAGEETTTIKSLNDHIERKVYDKT